MSSASFGVHPDRLTGDELAGLPILDRMDSAVKAVRSRLRKASRALDSHGIDYAVIGGNAVFAWVSTIDPGAARNTVYVDVLVRRVDLDRVRLAMEGAGFVFRHVAGIDMFLDRAGGRARDAVHLVYSAERVRPTDILPMPDVSKWRMVGEVRALELDALVQAKLTSFRDKDRTHIRDLIEVGLVDESWLERVPEVVAPRLKQILDTPEG